MVKPDFLAKIWVGLRILALLPAFALLVPLQALFVRLGFSGQRTLPVRFHRYLLRVLGVKVTLVGAPATERPLLIVSNHVSWLDIVVIGSLMPLSFIAKSDIAGWPLFGTLARLQRSIFVDRERRAHTAKVNEQIAARLVDGDALVLFGEGTTSDGGRVLPFRSALLGAARALIGEGQSGAQAGGMRVQGMTIAYTKIQGLPMGRADRPLIAWYGDMNLAGHLVGVLAAGAIDVTVSFTPPYAVTPQTDRKVLARDLETAVRGASVTALTGRVPVPLPVAAGTG